MVSVRGLVLLFAVPLLASAVYYFLVSFPSFSLPSSSSPSGIPRLSYFSSRGISEPIRLLLKDANVEYINNDLGTSVNGTPAEKFVSLRATGVLDYGSVPLWEEDGLKLVQSYSIIRHLARKYGYNGNNENEASKIDSLVEGCKDFSFAIRKVISSPPDQKLQVWNNTVAIDIPKWLGFFEALLKSNSNSDYFVGNKISYADIYIVSITEEIRESKLGLENYQLLSKHLQKIHSRPRIAAHVSDPSRFPPNFPKFIPK